MVFRILDAFANLLVAALSTEERSNKEERYHFSILTERIL